MKRLRTLLAPSLALALLLASLPSWACASTCAGGDSPACLRLCAISEALLTQNGKLPSLAADLCGPDMDLQELPGILSASVRLPLPQALPLEAFSLVLLPQARPLQILAGRAPPPRPNAFVLTPLWPQGPPAPAA